MGVRGAGVDVEEVVARYGVSPARLRVLLREDICGALLRGELGKKTDALGLTKKGRQLTNLEKGIEGTLRKNRFLRLAD